MATLEEIRDRVKRIIHDTAFTDEMIDGLINEGYSRCAGLVLLPDLESSGEITTEVGTGNIAIPASWNYDRNLFLCSQDNTKLLVLSSLVLFARKYPDYVLANEYGPVIACCCTQNRFIYYPIPKEPVTLKCAFYTQVVPLVNDADIPTAIPAFLQFKLLVSFACAEFFSEYEEGNDGVMVNTNKYTKKFNEAIDELQMALRVGQARPEPSREKGWI